MACRETREPSASCAMQSGPCSHRRSSTRRRVSSPSAAKTGAEVRHERAEPLRRMSCNVFLDKLRLMLPTAIIRSESLCPSLQWDPIEARLSDG